MRIKYTIVYKPSFFSVISTNLLQEERFPAIYGHDKCLAILVAVMVITRRFTLSVENSQNYGYPTAL